jgi:hypothetical protein
MACHLQLSRPSSPPPLANSGSLETAARKQSGGGGGISEEVVLFYNTTLRLHEGRDRPLSVVLLFHEHHTSRETIYTYMFRAPKVSGLRS